MWLTVLAPHFTANVAIKNDFVYDAAPIIKYMIGWDGAKVRGYCLGKGWRIEE